MNNPIPLHDTIKIRLIGSAAELLQYESVAGAYLPLPGTDKVVLIGDQAWIDKHAAVPPVTAAEQPTGDLHGAIMNIRCDVKNCSLTGASAEMSYKQGHRDARHAAAELIIAAPVAQEVTQQAALAEMESRKDAAYLERNQVVAALAKCFPSGVARTAIEGWSEDWHGCVYIDLPTGQASWHFHDSQAYLFIDLPRYGGKWDGHTTEEKYERISRLAPTTSTVSASGADGSAA